jgi:hypothetical protein
MHRCLLVAGVIACRYRDHLVRVDGGWKIARKQTFNDLRRA